MHMPVNATAAWFHTLHEIYKSGLIVSPRGKPTTELLQHTMAVDMLYPVVVSPTRRVSAKFLGAEAFWILSGDNRVETIAPYNRNIAQFSDDGKTFFGAYGPSIHAQLDYVVDKLWEDRDTRQAGLTIWRENPPPTKDVPCTISMFFNVRHGRLNNHVFMRSSDIWLGVPYDVFNFTMVANLVLCRLNDRIDERVGNKLSPGGLYLTAASRHLYEPQWQLARDVLEHDPWDHNCLPMPDELWLREDKLKASLDLIRRDDQLARWWEPRP